MRIILSRPDEVIINKKKITYKIVDFVIPTDNLVKLKENEKRVKYMDLARELKKTMNHESDVDTKCNWRARYSYLRIGTRIGGLGNKGTWGDHPNYTIVEIVQNTNMGPGDLRRRAVAPTPVEDHQITLVKKLSQE